MKLDKSTFRVTALDDSVEERDFWHTQKPHDRLLAIEQMRQIIYGYSQPSPRLQRILEIAQLPRD